MAQKWKDSNTRGKNKLLRELASEKNDKKNRGLMRYLLNDVKPRDVLMSMKWAPEAWRDYGDEYYNRAVVIKQRNYYENVYKMGKFDHKGRMFNPDEAAEMKDTYGDDRTKWPGKLKFKSAC